MNTLIEVNSKSNDQAMIRSVAWYSLRFNYKSFQESWRVKLFQNLIKVIERNTKIYDIKQVYYENITNKESNNS